jgi:transcriptional regulator with XRE-family HTH domain
MKQTIADNLTLYREGLGLSQKALAEKVGVPIENIENYENARSLPDSKTLSVLARVLDVTLDDLLRVPPTQSPDFQFRDRARFKQSPQFAAKVRRMLETYKAIEAAVGASPFCPETLCCDRLEGNEQLIQTTAARFRRSLGLGNVGLNLFQAVEEVGLKVLREAIAIPGFLGISACSFSRGAFVLVNTHNITIEQQFFTLARELGHLIFHRDEYGDTTPPEAEQKAREKVADYFASHLQAGQKYFNFPENQRYRQLIWRALELEKISEVKAAELLGLTVEQMPRSRRQEAEVYAIS